MRPEGAATYSAETKEKAMTLIRRGYEVCDVSESTGVPVSTLHSWCKKAGISLRYDRQVEKPVGRNIAPPVYPGGRGYRWGAGE